MQATLKTITWTSQKGQQITVTGRLTLSREVDADGWKWDAPCCELDITADVEGMGRVGSGEPVSVSGRPDGAVAKIGKLGLTAERLAAVTAMIDDLKSHPEYQAKMAREAKNLADAERMDSERRRNGLCPRCGTYCHGDCR